MEETKDTKARTEEAAPHARTRDEQATSSKTLSDLEETQTDAAAATTAGDGASGTSSPVEGSSPSPDGAADSAREGRADGSDTGGPM